MAIRGEFVVAPEMTSIPNGIRRRGFVALVVSHLSAPVRPKSPDLLATPRSAWAKVENSAIAVKSGIFVCLERRSSALDGTGVAELLHMLRRDTMIAGIQFAARRDDRVSIVSPSKS